MLDLTKPDEKPGDIRFSSGPTKKRPGYDLAKIAETVLQGRSHRSPPAKARMKLAIDKSREILGIPDDYLIGIVPASDTGAVEMCLWSMLGCRPVTFCAWENFGMDWVKDAQQQLNLDNVDYRLGDYGQLPDFNNIDPENDIVFTWNGTTSGVRIPNADFIAADRGGLTICDATSAAFAMDIDWSKIDVLTYSWQKVMGGEAAHGMLILSPRAVERLETYVPPRPLPKLFRMTKDGKINKGIFEGVTINTPSMLCVEDYMDTLGWAEANAVDGSALKFLHGRCDANLAAVTAWVEKSDYVQFMCADEATRSNTGITMTFKDAKFLALSVESQKAHVAKIVGLVGENDAGVDFNGYATAPPSLRIWGGATIDADDITKLTAWIDWAWASLYDELG